MHETSFRGFMATSECSYIDGLNAKQEYIALESCSTAAYQSLLERGWRRFGHLHFHPICDGCKKCESVRIVVDGFELSKSMRKVKTKNKNTKIILGRPSVNEEKLTLFNSYHAERSESKGWNQKQTSEQEYLQMLVDGANEFAYEVCYYIDDKLAGVDYIDVAEDGISAVYFISEPEFAKYSLGVYSILIQIELSRRLGLKYIYLGYAVRENKSLAYKFRYKPMEALELPAHFGVEPLWLSLYEETE